MRCFCVVLTIIRRCEMKRLLSGIKPSGDLNIGGYGGALRQYVKLQHDYESFFFIP
ncbi:hypothetical protein ACFRAK_27965, partial [Peribacillus sp. NPDC056705]